MVHQPPDLVNPLSAGQTPRASKVLDDVGRRAQGRAPGRVRTSGWSRHAFEEPADGPSGGPVVRARVRGPVPARRPHRPPDSGGPARGRGDRTGGTRPGVAAVAAPARAWRGPGQPGGVQPGHRPLPPPAARATRPRRRVEGIDHPVETATSCVYHPTLLVTSPTRHSPPSSTASAGRVPPSPRSASRVRWARPDTGGTGEHRVVAATAHRRRREAARAVVYTGVNERTTRGGEPDEIGTPQYLAPPTCDLSRTLIGPPF
jgi:hypothetical protein